jgi:hypothetical protein
MDMDSECECTPGVRLANVRLSTLNRTKGPDSFCATGGQRARSRCAWCAGSDAPVTTRPPVEAWVTGSVEGNGDASVGGFDLPENLALGAQQNDAPAAAHALGEHCGGVLGGGAAAGRHPLKIGIRVAGVESATGHHVPVVQ